MIARTVAVCAAVCRIFALAQRRRRDAQLQAVRKEIKALESRLAGQVAQREDVARSALGRVKAAAEARKLAELRAQLRAQQGQQRSSAIRRRCERRLARQRAVLASQVRLSYLHGRQELFKLLLSQESPATLGRMLVYYDYFNRARSERIGAVSTEVGKLRELGSEGDRVARELAELEAAQAAQVAALAQAHYDGARRQSRSSSRASRPRAPP